MRRGCSLLAMIPVITLLLVSLGRTVAFSGEGGAPTPDGVLGPELQISLPTTPECERYKPAVAYDLYRRQYPVVWHNTWPDGHRDIYARRVSRSGELLSWFSVSSGPNDRLQPAVAYNGFNDEYLVVWMYNANGDGTTYEIWGRIVSWDGSAMGPEFQIISWPNRTFWTPRVAYSLKQNQYLVAWNAYDATTLTATDVATRRVAANGDLQPVRIISANLEPQDVDVACNWVADEYLVVWRRMWTPADGDIFGARVRAGDGEVVSPPGEFAISVPSEDQRAPAVSTNSMDRYIVVWEHAWPGPCCDWDIRGQQLDNSGGSVGDEITFGMSLDDETSPAVATFLEGLGHDYVVAWERATATGSEVWAVRWTEGLGYSPSIAVSQGGFWDSARPAIAYGSPSFLFTYELDSVGDPTVPRHIYGRLWTAYAVFLPQVTKGW